MVVREINVASVAVFETEDHAPVRPNCNTPETFSVAFEPMQSEAWQIHVRGHTRAVQHGEDVLYLLN